MVIDAALSVNSNQNEDFGDFDGEYGVPSSPSELLRLQSLPSERVGEIIDLINDRDFKPDELLSLAVRLCRSLEAYHDSMVVHHIENDDTDRESLTAWARDAERLGQSGDLLEQVRL